MDFVLEHNLSPLLLPLRKLRHSAYLIVDQEIGLSHDAEDHIIAQRIVEQRKDLGVDRILLRGILVHSDKNPVKMLLKLLFYGTYLQISKRVRPQSLV